MANDHGEQIRIVQETVAGKEITNAELDAFLQNAPREQQAYVTNPLFRQQYLEQLISLHLFAQAGEDAKLEETEEFAKILENAKRDILAQLAMRETLKDVTVTDEEVAAYYEENKQQFTKGETVSAKHILVDSEEKCTSVLESITSGEKAFEEAASQGQKTFGQELNEKISEIFCDMTNGKYTQAVMDENLSMMVYDGFDHVDMKYLSNATVEQLYFALRLASADLLYENDAFPLFLDDVFGNYDDERLAQTMQYLSHHTDRQIFLFTGRKEILRLLDEKEILYHLISL